MFRYTREIEYRRCLWYCCQGSLLPGPKSWVHIIFAGRSFDNLFYTRHAHLNPFESNEAVAVVVGHRDRPPVAFASSVFFLPSPSLLCVHSEGLRAPCWTIASLWRFLLSRSPSLSLHIFYLSSSLPPSLCTRCVTFVNGSNSNNIKYGK